MLRSGLGTEIALSRYFNGTSWLFLEDYRTVNTKEIVRSKGALKSRPDNRGSVLYYPMGYQRASGHRDKALAMQRPCTEPGPGCPKALGCAAA